MESSPAPATAPASAQATAVQSGGAGSAPNGVLPPSAAAPPVGDNMHPVGLHAVGMQGMRMIMGNMHIARAMLDPQSEESKAADKMYQAGRKYFIPDMTAQQGPMPQMGAGQGGMPGQPPPMRGAQAGNQVPMTGQNNLPTGPVPMRQ
jgi:hypothetical protein